LKTPITKEDYRNNKMPDTQLESPESSSPIVTRAVAAGLRSEFCNTYHFPTWQRMALRLLGRFPQGAARFVISRFETFTGLNPASLKGFTINTLAEERLGDYAGLDGPFPAILVGAALGGASAHLALALGGPFLPQAFVTTLRGGAQDGNVQSYFRLSASLALEIAERDPSVFTIQHYDPIHDEWMTRYVNHLRFKLLDLPRSYADYIRQHLEPGGAVCYLDSQAQWLRYRVGPRSVFQVGGWGDISAGEFLEGSERIQQYCERVGLVHRDWRLPEFPLENGPESEWGSEAGLDEALEKFCQREGFRFVRIRLPEPHDYSRLAYQVVARLLQAEGRQPAGVLVEMFSQFDATAVQQSGLLPLWLIFNTFDSLDFLKSMRLHFPEGRPIFFSPLATFTQTPDLTAWQDWETALNGLDWRNIGTRSSHYPADSLALTEWAEPLHLWVSQHSQPIQAHLKAEDLLELASTIDLNQKTDLTDHRA
jgi:hypothetical protein